MNSNKTHVLIVTDLDGTLLGHNNYDLGGVSQALAKLGARGWPVIINTSKTAQEVRQLQNQLGLYAPCVVENGGAIVCHPDSDWQPFNSQTLVLGASQSELAPIVAQYSAQWRFARLSQLSIEAIVALTGLTPSSAEQARQRQYSEPLVWQDTPEHLEHFGRELHQQGLHLVQGGRFVHVIGDTDKALAMQRLSQAYEAQYNAQPWVIALGDSPNDLQMLQQADQACVIPLPGKTAMKVTANGAVYIATQSAPAGWVEAIDAVTAQLG